MLVDGPVCYLLKVFDSAPHYVRCIVRYVGPERTPKNNNLTIWEVVTTTLENGEFPCQALFLLKFLGTFQSRFVCQSVELVVTQDEKYARVLGCLCCEKRKIAFVVDQTAYIASKNEIWRLRRNNEGRVLLANLEVKV